MIYSKSWFDDNGDLWFAENALHTNRVEWNLFREFHMDYTGAIISKDNFNAMQKDLAEHYPTFEWEYLPSFEEIEKKKLPSYKLELIGKHVNAFQMRVLFQVEDSLIEKILIEKKE